MRSCLCGTRGIETKQVMKSKYFQECNQQRMGRGLLISLATALSAVGKERRLTRVLRHAAQLVR